MAEEMKHIAAFYFPSQWFALLEKSANQQRSGKIRKEYEKSKLLFRELHNCS